MLWSVWYEYDLIPYVFILPHLPPHTHSLDSEPSKRWVWSEGVYLLSWMKYQVFAPLVLLQLLNLFWYFLMLRILWRYTPLFFVIMTPSHIRIGPLPLTLPPTNDLTTKGTMTRTIRKQTNHRPFQIITCPCPCPGLLWAAHIYHYYDTYLSSC